MTNVTQNKNWNYPFTYTSSLDSAEWIVEAVTFGSISPLPNYNSVSFSDLSANGLDPGLLAANSISMSDPNGGTSTPCALGNGGDNFIVDYGGSCSHDTTSVLSVYCPQGGPNAIGPRGGPFSGLVDYCSLSSSGAPLEVTISYPQWLIGPLSPQLALAGGNQILFDCCNSNAVSTLRPGTYQFQVTFTNMTNGLGGGSYPATLYVTGSPKTVSHDFNGDGYSDVAWRDTAGDLAIWLMNGTQPLSDTDLGNVPTSWTIVGQCQLNNSGYADLIWRNTNGDVAIWLMNGTQILSAPDLANVPLSWTIVGTGPYSAAKGYAELFWRNTNGDVAIWQINGTQILAAPDLGNVPTSWTIAGTGDFAGTGNTDILWRNSNGDVAIWLMNGTQVVSAPDVGNVPTSWTIVGTGDFNGDGKTDILWRNADGDVAIWLMNGTQVLSAPDLGSVPASWTIAETGDFNGDGYSDILWRNANGDVAFWFMNGTQILSAPDAGNVLTSWTIQGANAD